MELKIISGGTEYAPLITTHSLQLDTQYTITVEEVSDNLYAVKVDDSTLFTFSMRSAPISSGYYSLFASGGTKAEFDDLSIEEGGQVVYSDDFTRPWGLATYEFEDSTNQYYGLENINEQWLALFDTDGNELIYYCFDRKPSGLTVRADENEYIREVVVTFPAPTWVWKGYIRDFDFTDSDGNGVPDIFEDLLPWLPDLVHSEEVVTAS